MISDMIFNSISDVIYDGDIQYNIFRKDLHYFWYLFGKKRLLNNYNKITGNRYGDYDIYELVREKKPKFISLIHLEMKKEDLSRFYKETKFKDLYLRID